MFKKIESPDLREVIRNNPELINLKRQQLRLERAINEYGK